MSRKIQEAAYRDEVMEMKLCECASKGDFQELSMKLSNYAPLTYVREFSEDLKSAPKQEEFNIALAEIEHMRK